MTAKTKSLSPTSGGLVMLKEMLPHLPPSEQKIARYILDHPREAVGFTAAELGERSQTSGAAVIRLCKSLGFKGLQELKLRVAGDLRTEEVEGYRDIQPGESQQNVIEKMTSNSIQTLKETAQILSPDELERATEAVLAARRIHFFGVGASAIIAQDAQQKFLRINKQATAFPDLHMAATLTANASEQDVVMGISFSGQTKEVLKILQLANKKGAATISLTRYGASPIADEADIRLFTSTSKEATFRSGATSSRLAQLHVIDILFMCVAARQYDQAITHLDQTREAIAFIQGRFNPKS
ncbi:DNA-binding MurR/RpiR family transcriptional regulator [Caldalkalibacillus uzonensis]|uniref:DNA-binding MurR/RpiR family transcriptional regulator n=1 Tax=Caldalkalibacillus uzonensis TaxID=353224 RepID=A0ABU0CXG7_9BACI|nr:MurR/RpiR family transcriptional regulator [Caldalkalibacillus uzonensis]MDQ0340022.1 DNA-binding MurR/RpiR family transcriptional regulator [Caldalkalibacillus uzonensis]